MNQARAFFNLLKTTFTEWNQDGAPRLAAALAYYTAFSLAPLLVIIIAIIGFVVSEDTVRTTIIRQVEGEVGSGAAQLVQDLIDNVNRPAEGIVSSILGIVTLLFGALGVFENLQVALDVIWDVDPTKQESGIVALIKNKLLSFGMLLVVGLLLLVSLVISTVIAALDTYVLRLLPASEILLQILSFIVSFGVITILFAMIYKYLPHVRVEWRDVWMGAAVTALLFSIGKTLLGLYLGNTSVASPYGAAGAFVLILLWVYYSAQIVLFGAEFTQVYARRLGSKTVSPMSAEVSSLSPAYVEAGAGEVQRENRQDEKKRSSIPELIFGVGVVVASFIAGWWQLRTRKPQE